MTIEEPIGAFDLEGELDQARRILFEIKEQLLEMQSGLKTHPDPVKGVKELTQFGGEYLKALNQVARHEVEIGKQRSVIRGVLQGGALDLGSARDEVLGRIARIRERG